AQVRLRRTKAARRNAAQLVARADVELLKDLAQVVLHRPWAEEQVGADLGVGETIAGETGDLRLLQCENVARFHAAQARGLRGREKLTVRPLGKPLSSDARERLVRSAKLHARIYAPVLSTKPLAVDELCSGQMNRPSAALESLDRFAVERL